MDLVLTDVEALDLFTELNVDRPSDERGGVRASDPLSPATWKRTGASSRAT